MVLSTHIGNIKENTINKSIKNLMVKYNCILFNNKSSKSFYMHYITANIFKNKNYKSKIWNQKYNTTSKSFKMGIGFVYTSFRIGYISTYKKN